MNLGVAALFHVDLLLRLLAKALSRSTHKPSLPIVGCPRYLLYYGTRQVLQQPSRLSHSLGDTLRTFVSNIDSLFQHLHYYLDASLVLLVQLGLCIIRRVDPVSCGSLWLLSAVRWVE